MPTAKSSTEEEAFNLGIGLGSSEIGRADKHFFDIAGYTVLDGALSPEQVAEGRRLVARYAADFPEGLVDAHSGGRGRELLNIVNGGGVLEDAMVLPEVLSYIENLIWGRQYRLVGSRAILRRPGESSPLTAGGVSDPRRYARYRCFGDGQFRCLLLTCYIALSDTDVNNGTFCAIPASHKSNLPHPFGGSELEAVPPLKSIPLRAGSAVLLTESLSHAFMAPAGDSQVWLAYHYGPSFMVNLSACDPSLDMVHRIQNDPVKAHLLLEPYYHPVGSQRQGKK